jgi:hypothetical protein
MRTKVSTISPSNHPLHEGEGLANPIMLPFSMREKGLGNEGLN